MMEHEALTGSSNTIIDIAIWGSIFVGLVFIVFYAIKYNEK